MMLTNGSGKRMMLRNDSGKNPHIRIPQGLRDILPTEASHRRMIENIIREVFTGWGYGEVIPPTFEYFDYISRGLGEDKKKGLVRLFDKNGELLALRSELTAPIARMTAMRFKAMGFPLRLFYFANVFSDESPRLSHQRERTQAGVELIGSDSPHADAEVIALVIEALLQVGLKDFKIGIGQIDFISKVLRLSGISESDQKEMKRALVRKDMVAIKNGLKELGSSRAESILETITLRGDAEVIVRASRYARDEASSSALARLSDIHKTLVRSGYRSHISWYFSL
ncbi:ATP phosphoribosyltransferase regulatory subunit [Candidatus Hakubella thermalkaliphila]|uniref:ATP phosphoribosyltransferase regulatory subunit n=1 Tax=Candidatus Hakubella thermalkaliphila TaxID=2754717 RepID=A0A6V8PT81_9ACTN|nr:ATP phosphoribosyltransferase regulatory subunit [Candidatus Hakubella thermalkaliphila]GFP35507.1 ATP phosphoribosyltransferase regulatory subunit [Candidatus Hakubella thermalkaliphila]